MRATFSLSPDDFKLLERAIAKRMHRQYGLFTLPYLLNVVAWMFVGICVSTYAKDWNENRAPFEPYGVLLLLALLAFVIATVRPFAIHRLYWRYLLSSTSRLTEPQSVELAGESLRVETSTSVSEYSRHIFIDHTEDKNNHYLYITGVQALIIPKSAAPSMDEAVRTFMRAEKTDA